MSPVSRIPKWIGLVGLAMVLALPLLATLSFLVIPCIELMFAAHYVPWRDNFSYISVFAAPTEVLDQGAVSGKERTCAFPDRGTLIVSMNTYARWISNSPCNCFGVRGRGQWTQLEIRSGEHFRKVVWACDTNIAAPFPPL
jgi:hypothetical protein